MNPEAEKAARSRFGIVAFLIAALIAAGALASVVYFQPGAEHTGSGQSTTEAQNTVTDDPLLDLPGLPMLYHETCVSVYSPFAPTTCDTTTSTVGVPQVFNMSSVADINGSVSATTYDQYFAFHVSENSTFQFAFRTTEPGWVPASGYVYYDGNGAFNFSDLRGEVVLSGQAQEISNSGTPNAPAGQFPIDSFSGQIAARPGAYIFDFNHGGGGTAYFLVRDVTALQNGITVSVGQPSTTYASSSGAACGGGPGSTGPGEEEFPVTVTSNTTTDVVLSSPSPPFGVWVEFVPSELQDVGPQGAHATMLLAGDTEVSEGGPNSASLFVDAFSPAGGLTGESVIPLHAAFGFTNILRSVGPVGFPLNPGYSGVTFFSLNSTANQTSFPPVADGNQTNYAVLTNVYDPGTVGGTQAASSLSVKITGVGLMQNGSEVALPSWIVVKPVNASFVMAADEPYDLQVCVTISDSPPLGDFTVALNESVNGQSFTGEMSVEIMP
ncbi:MAG: hypothetical protein OK441_05830 [Thaumarchaeota archaeon]|nr:hypothetical protein [Nitrososphaerota archaeon]